MLFIAHMTRAHSSSWKTSLGTQSSVSYRPKTKGQPHPASARSPPSTIRHQEAPHAMNPLNHNSHTRGQARTTSVPPSSEQFTEDGLDIPPSVPCSGRTCSSLRRAQAAAPGGAASSARSRPAAARSSSFPPRGFPSTPGGRGWGSGGQQE